MDVLAAAAHAVKGPHGHQQRQGRVKATRHAHDNRGDASEVQTTHQAFGLDGDDLLATGSQAVILSGDKRQTAHGTQQLLFLVIERPCHLHVIMIKGGAELHHAVREAAVDAALVLQGSDVDVGDGYLGTGGETLPFGQHLAVLGNDSVAAKDQVGCRFAIAARCVNISGDAVGTLVLDEVHQIGVLADELVARRQVHDHVGAIDGGNAAGRSGNPQVLTDLHSYTGTPSLKYHVGAKRHFGATHHNAVLAGNGRDVARGEPTFLVKLLIVGDIGLGNHPHFAVVDDNGAVEQVAAATQRGSHNDHHRRVPVVGTKLDERLFGGIEQQLVAKQIGTRVTRHA